MAEGMKSRAKLWYAGMALVSHGSYWRDFCFDSSNVVWKKSEGHSDDLSLQTNDVGITLGQRRKSCGLDYIKLTTGGGGMRTAPPSVCGSDDEGGTSLIGSSAEEDSGILLQSSTTKKKGGAIEII